jgi:hypothetical protein
MTSIQRISIFLFSLLCILPLLGGAHAAVSNDLMFAVTTADTLSNDSWQDGQAVPFQGGFVSGEMAAVRLDSNQPGLSPLSSIHFLFGGAQTTEQVRVHIWQDSVGGNSPGVELYAEDYGMTGSDAGWQMVDFSLLNIMVDGTFWVGLEFTHSGLPSVCRDNDGINTGRNFIFASDSHWYDSSLFGLTGDWVIRAVMESGPVGYTVGGTVTGLDGTLVLQNNGGDDLTLTTNGSFTFSTPLADGDPYSITVLTEPAGQSCELVNASGFVIAANVTDVSVVCSGGVSDGVLQNDSWVQGENVNFQSGFVAGEMAASRLVPVLSGPLPINNVHFLFGGETTMQPITLHIWQDGAGTDLPGVEIYSMDYVLTGSNSAWQEIDLSAEGVVVDGPFRVGIEFQHAGLPSVSRDSDGIIPDRNFIFASDGNWYESSMLGLTGDWIIRASAGTVVVPVTAPTISSINDVPNDQGRQVRLIWDRASYDAPGSTKPVTEYAIFRRQDAFEAENEQSRLFGWDFVSTVPAFGEDQYQYLAPTLCDSTVDAGVCWSVFMVRAMTANQYEFFDSVPDSGYSLDNLAPHVPDGFVVAYGADNSLYWEPCGDSDFRYFKVYRGTEPGFVIDPSQPLVTVVEPFWVDYTGGLGSFYQISSVDFAGNESLAVGPAGASAAGDLPPGKTALLGNAPNPFNPQTTISFELERTGVTQLDIFDVSGRLVQTLVAGETYAAGRYDLQWNGRDTHGQAVAAGVYFYHLKVEGFQQTGRMALIK